MINARSGLGFLIRQSESSLRFDLMYVAIVAVAVLGYAGRSAAAPDPPATPWRGRRQRADERLVACARLRPPASRAPRARRDRLGRRLARSGLFSPLIVPSIARIGYQLWLLVTQPASLVEVWYSVARGLGGFRARRRRRRRPGVVMGRSATAAACFGPILSGTYPIPKIALFPIFIYLFGIGSLSKVLLVFLECLYPIVITTQAGGRAVSRALVWSAANMGASRARILSSVVVPATAPFIFAGFRIAMPIALVVVIITEMISSADGLGYLVNVLAGLVQDRSDARDCDRDRARRRRARPSGDSPA